MKKKENNFAYIDGANLHTTITALGWTLDYARFRVWLTDKYHVSRAYVFIGLIPKYKDLYAYLQKSGFVLVFKEVVYDSIGKPKGNCDADLVLQAVCDTYENNFDKAIVVSSDGDYASLVRFLQKKNKISAILSPALPRRCSIFLKKTNIPISYINDKRTILRAQKEKAPSEDETSQGSFS